MQTMQQFCDKHGISADVEWTDSNPNIPDMMPGSKHYRVTLKRGRKRMMVPYSCGPAITSEPTAAQVLDCLVSDVSYADETFEDFRANLGYDTDSRKAERVYKAVVKQSRQLKQFLGELLDEAMYQTERE